METLSQFLVKHFFARERGGDLRTLLERHALLAVVFLLSLGTIGMTWRYFVVLFYETVLGPVLTSLPDRDHSILFIHLRILTIQQCEAWSKRQTLGARPGCHMASCICAGMRTILKSAPTT